MKLAPGNEQCYTFPLDKQDESALNPERCCQLTTYYLISKWSVIYSRVLYIQAIPLRWIPVGGSMIPVVPLGLLC